jgi:diguanylate cyclase (GGDEF)-like protein
MSFRTRLTLFFVLIVIVPMAALAVVVVRLVGDSEQGKATARSAALVSVARDDYRAQAARAARQAAALAADPALAAAIRRADAPAARARAARLAHAHGLARVRVLRGRRTLAAVGDDAHAVAGGVARVTTRRDRQAATIEVAALTARGFARLLPHTPGVEIALVRDGRLLAAVPPLPGAPGDNSVPHLPARGTITLHDTDYAVASFRAADLGNRTDTVAVLATVTSTSTAIAHNTWLALALLAALLLLALAGALVVSRQLQAQLAGLLAAAKRIGKGDLDTTVPVQGHDELAELAREFNRMSAELARRIEQLGRERGRLRSSIQRIGETFAAGLDRDALLEIGVQTAVDAVEADCGRAATIGEGGRLDERARAGAAPGEAAAAAALIAAERQALAHAHAAAVRDGDVYALAAPIAREGDRTTLHGLIAVARRDRPFDDAERDLVASLARQTGLSLENVELHDRVQRQAVTDDLTGLFNHRRFQEVIASEVAAARRYDRPLALLLLDIDDFKAINDTHGHQQGDVVLREVGRVLRECSREIDEPARYGGEEMAVALPQTDLEGAYAIAERVRRAVEALAIPRLDGSGSLSVTVSCGVAAGSDDKDALVADADAALYSAKRAGKNRTVRAPMRAVRPLPVGELQR